MEPFFENLIGGYSPAIQALLAGCFTWSITALGAAVVFVTAKQNQKLLDAMLGFAAGVMIAASVWSLIIPGIDLAAEQGRIPWMVAAVGFLAGGIFLRIGDHFLPHLHLFEDLKNAEGPRVNWRRTTLLVLAITLHNIPEGLAVGFTFGAAAEAGESATLGAAVALAVGIGLQNFPEGLAVAMPLRADGLSKGRSFWYGQLSGFVEPLAAVFGAAAVTLVEPILPYALCFAAGAMIYVVVEELIPESQSHGNTDLATLGAMGGFVVMMTLDVALG